MKKLSETDHGISNEGEDDIENKLSWYESEPELNASSYTNIKTDGSDTQPEDKVFLLVKKLEERTDIYGNGTKTARRTPRQNIITGTPGQKSKGREADMPLESFELLLMILLSEIVIWTNKKMENIPKQIWIHIQHK